MQINLETYLMKHPDCEIYNGQDSQLTADEKRAKIDDQRRVRIWSKAKGKCISGNAAPQEKNLMDYLRRHPDCEVYNLTLTRTLTLTLIELRGVQPRAA